MTRDGIWFLQEDDGPIRDFTYHTHKDCPDLLPEREHHISYDSGSDPGSPMEEPKRRHISGSKAEVKRYDFIKCGTCKSADERRSLDQLIMDWHHGTRSGYIENYVPPSEEELLRLRQMLDENGYKITTKEGRPA